MVPWQLSLCPVHPGFPLVRIQSLVLSCGSWLTVNVLNGILLVAASLFNATRSASICVVSAAACAHGDSLPFHAGGCILRDPPLPAAFSDATFSVAADDVTPSLQWPLSM